MKSKSKRLAQRIISIIMSVMMVVTLLPAEFYTGLGMAGESKAATRETSILNADELTTTSSNITANTELSSGFTLMANTNKPGKIIKLSDSIRGYVPNASKSFTNAVQIEGGKIAANKGKTGEADADITSVTNAIKFSAGANAHVIVYTAVKEDGKSGQIQIYKATENDSALGTKVKESAIASPGIERTITKVELDLDNDEGGEFYIGLSASGGIITYLEIESDAASTEVEYRDFTNTYDFTDGSIIPNDTSLNGTANVTSADGLLTVKAGNKNGYGYNGTQHGSILKNGNSITIKAPEGGYLASIKLGGCKYSGAGAIVTVTSDGTLKEVPGTTDDPVSTGVTKTTKTSNCYDQDATSVVTFDFSMCNDDVTEAVLTFGLSDETQTSNVTYVPCVIVTGKEPVPEVTDVDVTVTTTTTNRLAEAVKVYLVNKADATDKIDVTTSGTKTLKVGATYAASVTNTTDGDDIAGLAATINEAETFKVKEDTTAIAVKVVTTTTAVGATFDGDDLGDLNVVAKDSKTTYTLSDTETVELPKNTTFTVYVAGEDNKESDTWTAKIGDENTFKTTGTESMHIKVDVKNVSDVDITPEISGKGLLGTNKIYFTKEGSTDGIDVTSGEVVTLKPNQTYNVSLKTAAGAAVEGIIVLVDGASSFKTGKEAKTVTVEVSTPATKTTTWDFSSNNATKFSPGDFLTNKDKTSNGIYYKESTQNKQLEYEATQFRFRAGCVLYLPLQDNTTKITYAVDNNGDYPDRLTYLGSKTSGYTVAYTNKKRQSLTIGDITDYVQVMDGKRYFPIYSGGDIKLLKIILTEYNPVNEVTVSGTIANAAEAGITKVSFKNLDNTKAEMVSTDVDADGKFSVILRRVDGETRYAAVINKTGYKIQDADNADKFTLIGNEATATVNSLSVAAVDMAAISGTLTGPADSMIADKGGLKLQLKPDNEAMTPIDVALTKVADGEYSFQNINIEIGREYTPTLINADDYEVKNTLKLEEGSVENGATISDVVIAATAKPVYKVSGKFVTSNRKASDVTKITFTNKETPAYTYSVDVTGNTYEINLRDADYETSVVSEAFEPFDHVKVDGKAVTNDVYLIGEADTSEVPYQETITVGTTVNDVEITTIMDAVNYISRMTRTADQRVTIVLGNNKVYREQLLINIPNITIQGNGSTVTWYYGVGFSYYSAKPSTDGKNGAYYDEAYAVDKYTKTIVSQNPGHWGATVNLLTGATGFRAEDLTFENSLNRYMTEAELEDGAGKYTGSEGASDRAEGLDVTLKTSKERACVLYIQADNTEYNNCKLLSRQDTLYTGDNTENSYFKNCLIEGTVDYICGDGNAVFDGCTLSMYGYPDASSNTAGSVIVANKAKANHGYLFNNCEIVSATGSEAPYNNLGKSSAIVLARAWDAGTVYWLNTKVPAADSIAADKPYIDMNATAAAAHYYEYNTHYMNGETATPITTSGRTAGYGGTILTAEEAAAVDMTKFFDDWVPSYYDGEITITLEDINLKITAPSRGEAVDKTVTTTNLGFTLGDLKWYAGETEFTGTKFAGTTVYTAKITLTPKEHYVFADDVAVTVAGSADATIVKNEDGTATVTVTYPETAMEGYWAFDFTNHVSGQEGLVAGKKYADGILEVLGDMPGQKDGGSIAGAKNPSPNAGKIPTLGSAVKVTVPEEETDSAGKKYTNRFTITAKSSKTFYLVRDDDGAATVVTSFDGTNEPELHVFNLDAGKTYYFYASGSNQLIYNIIIEHRVVVRGDWDKVADPVIDYIAVGTVDAEDSDEDGEKDEIVNKKNIYVHAKGEVGDNGADTLEVDMLDETGKVITTKKNVNLRTADADATSFVFTPDSSGTYTFKARLVREGETDKVSKVSDEVKFALPLTDPVFQSITNKGTDKDGKCKLEVAWYEVKEAKKYRIQVFTKKGEGDFETLADAAKSEDTDRNYLTAEPVIVTVEDGAELVTMIEGLEKANKAYVSLIAIRGENDTSEETVKDTKITGIENVTWIQSSYGLNANKNSNNQELAVGNSATILDDGRIELKVPTATKLQPTDTDGLLFYYTKLDASKNFTFTAKITNASYQYDNGQEGFGIMVSDAAGKDKDSSIFWNNSYQAGTTKFDYKWDPVIENDNYVAGSVYDPNDPTTQRYVGGMTNVTADGKTVFTYKMRLGVGYVLKDGVTLEDQQRFAKGEITKPANVSYASDSFESTIPSAVMKALYNEKLITNESTEEEVQEAFMNYTVERKDSTVNNTVAGEFNNIAGGVKNAKNLPKTILGEDYRGIEEFLLQIQRNNNGYVLRYLDLNELDPTDEKVAAEIKANEESAIKSNASIVAVKWNENDADGNPVITYHRVLSYRIVYDDNRNNLLKIDNKNICVGFFGARLINSVIIDKYSLQTVDAKDDLPADPEKVPELVRLSARVLSANTSNKKDYDLQFTANADGVLSVVDEVLDEKGNVTSKKTVTSAYQVTAGKTMTVVAQLENGRNKFTLRFTPDKNYRPGVNQVLASYNTKTILHTVSYQESIGTIDGDDSIIYVSPRGTSANRGTSTTDATDIFTAVAYAKAGQKIYMSGETYKLGGTRLRLERGNDGTKNAFITLQTNPDDYKAGKRAVLDFERASDKYAVVLKASYWHFKDFDVTGSENNTDGINVAGKYNVLENLQTYKNGNTGIQISRDGSDGRDLWPAYNTVLNCTSYLNYDDGFEDADGFAAKLTVGDGNKFIGCVAAYNADDGWDLFAKTDTGAIGAVTIENCVAYKNGYLLGSYTINESNEAVTRVFTGADAVEFSAGNGNGFKLGGSGISGHHVLRNSTAFLNKAYGITSNSCPDDEIYNCTSYSNELANIDTHYYDNNPSTHFVIEGQLSYGGTDSDQIKFKGDQIRNKIFNSSNYFWNGTIACNRDSEGNDIVATALSKNEKDIFVSTKPADAGIDVANGKFIARKDNGSINLGNFLKLTDTFKENNSGVGADPQDTPGGNNPSNIIDGVAAETSVYGAGLVTLSDISVPTELSGYSWKYPETLVAPFLGTSAELAVVEGTGDGADEQLVRVNFVDVTGIELVVDENDLDENGEATLFGDKTLTLHAKPVYTPAEVDLTDVQKGSFTFTFTDKAKMGLTAATDTTEVTGDTVILSRTSGAKEGIAKYTVAMQLTATGSKTKVIKKNSSVVEFVTRDAEPEFKPVVGDTEGVFFDENAPRITVAKGVTSFSFSATVDNVKNAKGPNDAVKITVGDTKVLKYDAKKGIMQVVDTGATYIQLTAAADKTVVMYIPVIVQGEAFTTNVSLITLDRAKTTGVQFNAIETTDIPLGSDIEIDKIYKGTKAAGTDLSGQYKASLKIENDFDNYYYISIVDKDDDDKTVDMIKAGTYTIVMKSGDGTFEPLTVKVIETRPVATFKQSKKVNLFYAAGTDENTGYVTASSKLANVRVEQVGTNDGSDDFRLDENGKGYDIVMTSAASEKAVNKLNKKIPVTVSFDGYKDYCNKAMVINVATVTQAPKLILEVDNKVLYTALGMEDTKIRVLNKTTGQYVTNADVALASSKPAYKNANKAFNDLEDLGDGEYRLSLKSLTKGGTAKISVSSEELFGKDRYGNPNEVILNAPVSVNKNVPKATFNKLVLSGQKEYVGKEEAVAEIILKNAKDIEISDLTVTGKGKSSALRPYLEFAEDRNDLDHQILKVHFTDTEDGKSALDAVYDKKLNKTGVIKPGSYSFTATYKVKAKDADDEYAKDMTTNFTLRVAPLSSANTKVKGKLDLLNRTGSQLKISANLKNLNGTIVGMKFGDNYISLADKAKYKAEFGADNMFDVAWDDSSNAAIVTLKEDGIYRVNGKYKVVPVFVVETAYDVVEVPAKAITIVTKQSNVKFSKLPALEARLSALTDGNTDAAVSEVMTVTAPANAEIESLVQTTGLKNFKVDYSDKLNLKVYITNTAGLKANKTYSIKLNVNPVGRGAGARQQTMTIRVKITK